MATSNNVTVTEDKSDMFSDETNITDEIIERQRTFGFDVKSAKTDLILLVEDKNIYVTRVVLELLSPAFEKIFSEQLLDGEQNEVKIHGKTFEDFVEFLACIYPGTKHRVTMVNVNKVLPLASEYDIDFLVERCEAVLIDEMSKAGADESFILQCGNTAMQYNLLSLRQKSLNDIGKRLLEEIDTLDDQLLLEDKGRLMVYDKMLPSLRSEACRNRYLSAGRNCKKIMNLKLFTDAKYKGLYFQLDVAKENAVSSEVVIWNVRWKIDVKKSVYFIYVNFIPHVIKYKNLPCFHVACKVVVKNNDLQCSEGDFSIQEYKFVSGNHKNTSSNLILDLEKDELDNVKYRMNGVYAMSVHILMNIPMG